MSSYTYYSYPNKQAHSHGREALRVQWFQARARMIKSRRVCDFLRGELDRTVATFQFRARWWEGQITINIDRNIDDYPDYREGANAYTFCRALLCRSMERRCIYLWRSIKNWIPLPSNHSSFSGHDGGTRTFTDADESVEGWK